VVPEANLTQTEHGAVAGGDGWYVLNLRDAEWRHTDGRGAVCVALDDFEGMRRDVQFGLNPFVLLPGEPMALYHWEGDQEALLVISGEATLLVEDEESALRAWDLVSLPPGTRHALVGAGDGPCVVIAVGSRQRDELGFPADETAKRHGASVAEDTRDGGVAYADVPPREPTRYRDGWLPG
jgi:uncharacterized cupin superfamily protein